MNCPKRKHSYLCQCRWGLPQVRSYYKKIIQVNVEADKEWAEHIEFLSGFAVD